MRTILISITAGLLIGIALGLLICYQLWHVEPRPSTEPVRPAAVQSDGSVLVARVPVAEPGPPPHKLPAGAKEERRVRVVVQPLSSESRSLSSNPDSLDKDHFAGVGKMVCSCDPIAVDLSLVRERDGTSGIVASADGGTVDARASVDIPILQDSQPEYRNALGVTWRPEPAGDAYGVLYQRDVLSRFRVGAAIEYQSDGVLQGQLQALWRY